MNFVDTHCHIQSLGQKRGEDNTIKLWHKSGLFVDEVIKNAQEDNVSKLICVGCDLEDSKLAINFVQQSPNLYSSIGIHPHEARNYVGKAKFLNEFSKLAKEEKVVSIGECGLDYFYSHSEPSDQAELLRFQLNLAQETGLPVIFHVREAFDDFWPIFDSYKGIKGVLHSFTDSVQTLELALARGLFIGVNGIATFAKKAEEQAMFKSIPLEYLLLETDSPYLTPAPYRGTINEPKHIVTVAKYLSGIKEISLEEIARKTSANADLLFAL